MSDPESDAKPPSYGTIITSTDFTVHMYNVPLSENGSPPPPPYYPPTPNQVWSPHSVTPPWSMDNNIPQDMNPSPSYYKAFLKSKPKALGIVIILAVILDMALGIALAAITFTYTVTSGIPFWGPLFYVIAGSLTLVVHQKPNLSLIKGSLTMSSISCILSIMTVILNVIDLATTLCYSFPRSNNSIYYNNNVNAEGSDYYDLDEGVDNHLDNHQSGHHNRSSYQIECPGNLEGIIAVLSLLLITNLLLFFVTFTISVFGCQSLSKAKSAAPQVYVIPNDGAIKKLDTFPEFSNIPAHPPPYIAN
ncbi:uncharacterized protein [Pyxicephalus adspersus]|uniref:uncharacterized protein n=1 Tax=Pyxicephalus adspersus TaxID=30357 RepID=UPI003B5CE2E8